MGVRRSPHPGVSLLFGMAVGIAACVPGLGSTPEAQENMPLYASIWLTAEPPIPVLPVQVDLTVLPDPGINRSHTFVPGTALRGSFPVSSGEYRLIGLGGKCAMDLVLAPESETDVVIKVAETGGCEFARIREHRLADGILHEEPSVLVVPD